MIMKKVFFSITLVLLISVPCLFAQPNIVANGQFDDGDTGWGGWIAGDTDVDVEVDTTYKLSGKNSYRLVPHYHPGDTITYYIQRNIDCPIQLGHVYKMSLMAVASDSLADGSTINALLEMEGSPYTKTFYKSFHLLSVLQVLYCSCFKQQEYYSCYSYYSHYLSYAHS